MKFIKIERWGFRGGESALLFCAFSAEWETCSRFRVSFLSTKIRCFFFNLLKPKHDDFEVENNDLLFNFQPGQLYCRQTNFLFLIRNFSHSRTRFILFPLYSLELHCQVRFCNPGFRSQGILDFVKICFFSKKWHFPFYWYLII